MFKRRKSYEDSHATLLNSNATAKEKEEIVLSLLNDNNSEEVEPIFIDYLKVLSLAPQSNHIDTVF